MARMEQVQSITLEAGSDLSSAQFTFVAIASDGQVDQVAGAGLAALGVLLNDPDAAGKAATVAYAGRVKVVAGATLVPGDRIQSDASGAAITTIATADVVLGTCLVGGASGEVVEVLLHSQHVSA